MRICANLDRGDGSHETVLCVANLSRFAQPVSLDLAAYAGMEPVEMLGYVPFPTIRTLPYIADACAVFLSLARTAARHPGAGAASPEQLEAAETPAEIAPDEAVSLGALSQGWPGLLPRTGRALIESALPGWLQRQRWFGAKSSSIQSVSVLDWVELPLAERPAVESPEDKDSRAGDSPSDLLC